MIIKLHGNSGSGKTTIARALMGLSTKPVVEHQIGRRIEANEVHPTGLTAPLYVLGSYRAICGGMDSISEFDQHPLLIDKYAAKGHVLYEGLLASEFYGKIGDASVKHGKNYVFAFLDTPLDVCIERILERRKNVGNLKPLNEANTRARPEKMARLRARLDAMGRITVTINYQNALNDMLAIYEGAESGS